MTDDTFDGADAGPQPAGLPAWMATFADLMCLLMCFFVLLFAFSKVEEEKFKQMAGSMREAFGGVQYIKSNSEDATPGMEQGVVSRTGSMAISLDQRAQQQVHQQVQETRTEDLLDELRSVMQKEIAEDSIVIERDGEDVVIRFPEHVSFDSGQAQLVAKALPLIRRVVSVIPDGQDIVVAGHTDNIPIRSGRFGSNWQLSAARAAEVAQQVLLAGTIAAERLTVAGYADTRPLEPNTSRDNRARNRRVEIIVKASINSPAGRSEATERVIELGP